MRWKKLLLSSKKKLIIDELQEPVKFSLYKDGITQSLISKFSHCPRCFYLSLRLWEGNKNTTKYANGTLTHEILDRCYTMYIEKQLLPSVAVIKKWIYNFDKENPDWLPQSKPEVIEQFKAISYVMVTEYLRFYKKDFVPNRLIGAEDEFDIRFKGYRLRGKKDLRFQIPSTVHNKMHRWIMETKTMARISETDLAYRLPFNFQNLLYVIAEEIEYDVPVYGVLYNIIRNPGQKEKVGETLLQYVSRLRSAVRKDPKHFFKRFEIPYSKKDKNDFKIDLEEKLRTIDSLLQGDIYPYKNENNCVNPFHCEYLPACSTGQLIGYTRTKTLFKELDNGKENLLQRTKKSKLQRRK